MTNSWADIFPALDRTSTNDPTMGVVIKLYDSFTVCCNQIPAVSLQKANTIKSTATSANIEVKLKIFTTWLSVLWLFQRCLHSRNHRDKWNVCKHVIRFILLSELYTTREWLTQQAFFIPHYLDAFIVEPLSAEVARRLLQYVNFRIHLMAGVDCRMVERQEIQKALRRASVLVIVTLARTRVRIISRYIANEIIVDVC